MWIIVLTVSLQYGLIIDKTTVEQRATPFTTLEACEARARELEGPLPIPQGYSAKWQAASCKKV